MTAATIPADAEQVEAQCARTLLELAGAYTRQALNFPDEVAALRTILAEVLLEQAALHWQLDRLADRVETLERRTKARR